jgi:hypothetical protein
MTIAERMVVILALVLISASGDLHAQTFVRMEIHPVQTVTLKTQQFLTGDLNGKPAVIAGELRIPNQALKSSPRSCSSTAQEGSAQRWIDGCRS